MTPDNIIHFWFTEIAPVAWWTVDPEFDRLLTERFGDLLRRAAAAELYAWRSDARGRLAEIIVLDQFSRNVCRNTAQAFAQDAMALALAQEAVASGAHRVLAAVERAFLLLPYMHSESRLIHVQAEVLFREFAPPGNFDSELRHKAIVDRFGRYPHRNALLGRRTTPEEAEFLKTPGSSF
ncbi:MAG: DUF924 family protein [Steroidobacteraceae bacterium]